MTDRASIDQIVQLGVQSAAGTGVAATKILGSLDLNLSMNLETQTFRPKGYKFTTIVSPGKEWSKSSLGGKLTYTEIVYILSTMMNYAAPAQQGATTAYKWTFTPSANAPDVTKYYTIEQGSSVRAHKAIDCQFTGLELEFTRDDCAISGGELIGQAIQDGISLSGGTSEIALVPVLPTQVDVKTAATQAGLAGASALSRVIKVTWGLTDRYGPIWPLGTTFGTGFAGTIETEPKLTAKLLLEADAEGMGYLTDARAGDKVFLQVNAVGAVIDTPYTYEFNLDMSAEVSAVSDFSDEDGLECVEWELTGVPDSTWGETCQIDVTNLLTTL